MLHDEPKSTIYMYQIFNTLLQDRLLLKPRKSLDKTIQNISSAPGKKPSRSVFFLIKQFHLLKEKVWFIYSNLKFCCLSLLKQEFYQLV